MKQIQMKQQAAKLLMDKILREGISRRQLKKELMGESLTVALRVQSTNFSIDPFICYEGRNYTFSQWQQRIVSLPDTSRIIEVITIDRGYPIASSEGEVLMD